MTDFDRFALFLPVSFDYKVSYLNEAQASRFSTGVMVKFGMPLKSVQRESSNICCFAPNFLSLETYCSSLRMYYLSFEMRYLFPETYWLSLETCRELFEMCYSSPETYPVY